MTFLKKIFGKKEQTPIDWNRFAGDLGEEFVNGKDLILSNAQQELVNSLLHKKNYTLSDLLDLYNNGNKAYRQHTLLNALNVSILTPQSYALYSSFNEKRLVYSPTEHGTTSFQIENFDKKISNYTGIQLTVSGKQGYLPIKIGDKSLLLQNISRNTSVECYSLEYDDIAKILLEDNDQYINETNALIKKRDDEDKKNLADYNEVYQEYEKELEKYNACRTRLEEMLANPSDSDDAKLERKGLIDILNNHRPKVPNKPSKATIMTQNYLELFEKHGDKSLLPLQIEIFVPKKDITKIAE